MYAPLSSSLAWPSLGRRFVQHGMSVTNVGYVEHSNSSLDAPAAAAAVIEPARTAEASCVVVEASALLGTGPRPC